MRPGGVVERFGKLLPRKLRFEASFGYKQFMFNRLAREVFGDRLQSAEPGPVPPPALITTEALMGKADLELACLPARYFGGGYRDAWNILWILRSAGIDAGAFGSIVDFGCGSGRVLRHFRNVDGLRPVGTDANAKAIEWDRANLPGIEFHNNELAPPLDLPDGSFDLVYALSVFTHIPLQWQEPWLRELRRILRPGGYLLCTVLGDNYIDLQLGPEERVRLAHDGRLTLDADDPHASYSSQVLRSWDVFQTRDEVGKSFGSVFDILAYTEFPAATGQDTLLLQSPDARRAH